MEFWSPIDKPADRALMATGSSTVYRLTVLLSKSQISSEGPNPPPPPPPAPPPPPPPPPRTEEVAVAVSSPPPLMTLSLGVGKRGRSF